MARRAVPWSAKWSVATPAPERRWAPRPREAQSRRQNAATAQQQQAATQQASSQQQAAFAKARAACLEGRGYSVK